MLMSPIAPIDEAERREAENLRKLKIAWSDYLDRYGWGAFVTLTFTHAPTEDSARRSFSRWVRRVEQRTGVALDWFYALEASAADRLHVHALVGAARPITLDDLRAAWTFGRADVQRYDPRRGARGYLVKDMGTRRLVNYDQSVRLARIQLDPVAEWGEPLCAGSVRTARVEPDTYPA
jgi:hypothetical protein